MQTRLIPTSLIAVLALSVTSCTRIPAATPASGTTAKAGFMGTRARLLKRQTAALPKALPLRRISTHRGTCPTPNLGTVNK